MTLRRGALWGLLLAKAVAGIGVGWDIRWHVVIGRDSFWIAPHVMTYAGVAAAAILSFGVLVVDTWSTNAATRRRGTLGYHLAWWGIALTIIAAPIDDLWHRLFGIDVTLWSPPHLLGLAGAQINSLACLLIAREVWPVASRARSVALAIGALLLFSGFQTGVDPALRTAFIHGGVRYFTFALLGGLFFTFTLVLTARLAGSRTMPIVVVIAAVGLQLAVIVVGDLGLAILRPQPAVAGAIAADPSSPIAIAHEIARRNGTTPGRGFTVRLFPVVPAIVLAFVDPRRRPLAAGLAFGLALYAVNGVMFMRSPAFAHVHPEPVDALLALVGTVIVALCAALLALAFETLVSHRQPARVAPGAVPVTPRA